MERSATTRAMCALMESATVALMDGGEMCVMILDAQEQDQTAVVMDSATLRIAPAPVMQDGQALAASYQTVLENPMTAMDEECALRKNRSHVASTAASDGWEAPVRFPASMAPRNHLTLGSVCANPASMGSVVTCSALA